MACTNSHESTWAQTPKEWNPHQHRCKNLKFHNVLLLLLLLLLLNTNYFVAETRLEKNFKLILLFPDLIAGVLYTEIADQYKQRRSPTEAGGWLIQTQYQKELGSDAFV